MNLTVFNAGFATMAVEFGASRLLGNVFGTSNLVWAVIIGLILVYLTLGNWLGGKLADRRPDHLTFFTVIALAGFFVALVPLISRPLLSSAADAFDTLNLPLLAGSFLTVLILFSLPVTILGMVMPFALKLMIADTAVTGKISGRVSAISTLGSFLGTFLTVLLMIPTAGTYRTFLIISLILLLTALPGLLLSKSIWRSAVAGLGAAGVLLLAILGPSKAIKASAGQIYETESAYNYIQVLELQGFRFLRLNEGQGVHSIYHPTQTFYAGPWSQFLVGPLFNPAQEGLPQVERIAILGLAAGTTARQAASVYPEARVEGFELDPKIIVVGQEYFGMNLPELTVHVEDARWGLTHSPESFDLVAIDAYQVPYIPAHLVTVEFFEEVSRHLTAQGVVAVNVGRAPGDRTLVDSIATTLLQVFPNVFLMDLPDSFNSVLFACKDPHASWENFAAARSLISVQDPGSLLDYASALTLQGKSQVTTPGRIFTDDLAPIEAMTNRLVLNLIFQQEVEALP